MTGYERRKQQKRDQIIRSAIELFREHGIKKTTVQEIATAAAVSQVTIYNHFGDKHQLVSSGGTGGAGNDQRNTKQKCQVHYLHRGDLCDHQFAGNALFADFRAETMIHFMLFLRKNDPKQCHMREKIRVLKFCVKMRTVFI